jgi:hypothetical protein
MRENHAMSLKDIVADMSGVGNWFGKAAAYALAREGVKLSLIPRELFFFQNMLLL